MRARGGYVNRIGLMILLLSNASIADITDSYRNENAVVLYDFAETSGLILDKSHSKFGEPLNLEIYYPQSAIRTPGTLEISEPNVIRSVSPADKITQLCKAAGSVTIEAWIENNETVEKRAGGDASKRPQPLRIAVLSNGLLNRNFLLGQFYDMGNQYIATVKTSKNEGNLPANIGNSLKDPLVTTVDSTLVPDPTIGRLTSTLQKVIISFSSRGVNKIYLSNKSGFIYEAKPDDAGTFLSSSKLDYFSNWQQGAYLTLGNESMSREQFSQVLPLNRNFQGCNTARNSSDQCFTNPNRYWKGKFHLFAVYCNEIPKNVVLGEGGQNTIKPLLVDIDINTQITPTRLRAQDIYQRLTGVKTPIANPVLFEMENLIHTGNSLAAASKAIEDNNGFYNVTVRDFAAKMSNREETIDVPLNDFTATVIGAVRDEVNAQNLLTENISYVADPNMAAVPSDIVDDMLRSNNHYEGLTSGRFDLKKVLKRVTQKLFNGTMAVDNPTPAGLLTTRQWMAAHAIAGTNRRLVEYSFRQFTCQSMDAIADSSGPDNIIAPDIDRFPGGSHSKFVQTCRACHTIMDGFRPAFSRWTFSNRFAKHSYVVPKIGMNADEDNSIGMITSPDFVSYKLNKNQTVFVEGRITQDDSWVNNANRGANKDFFKWSRLSGNGVRDFGAALAESAAFPRCMAERVFKQVCKRSPASVDKAMLDQVSKEFSTERSFNLKYLFQRIVTTDDCLGRRQ